MNPRKAQTRPAIVASLSLTLCVLAGLVPLVNWGRVESFGVVQWIEVRHLATRARWSPPALPYLEVGYFHGDTFHAGSDDQCKCMVNFGMNNAY